MSTKQFNDHERWAVFETHGSHDGTRCWLCGEPVTFEEMVIDHIIPEHLVEPQYKAELRAAISAYGLDDDFDLNSYANWLPAHGPCNNKKSDRVLRPTPLVQVWLEKAAERAPKALAAAQASASDLKLARALTTIFKRGVPREEIDRLIQRYASANAEAVVVGTKFSVPNDPNTIGLAYHEPIYRYIPPATVHLSSEVTVIFDQEPARRQSGPFVYTTAIDPATIQGSSANTKLDQ